MTTQPKIQKQGKKGDGFIVLVAILFLLMLVEKSFNNLLSMPIQWS